MKPIIIQFNLFFLPMLSVRSLVRSGIGLTWMLVVLVSPRLSFSAEPGIHRVFDQHCVKCHGQDGKIKGEVNLIELRTTKAFKSDLDLLAKVIQVVKDKEMPPEDEPLLEPQKRERFIADLETLLQESLGAGAAIPRTPIRRMNRFQYANAVTDLFDLNVEVFALPESIVREYGNYFRPETGKMPDKLRAGSRPLGKSQLIAPRLADVAPFPQDLRAEHGFDNRADHLTLSPILMEAFLNLSKSIVNSQDFHTKTCGIWDEFFAEPTNGNDLEAVIEQRLQWFLRRAFRRSVDDAVMKRYSKLAISLYRSGTPFTECMKEVAAATLVSSRFLYLFDGRSTGDQPEPLDDFELASRLSFFLWGSIPDPTLLELAEAERLHHPDVLEAQVDRMLKDGRLKRFCDSFPAQWLQLEQIIASVPDRERFPEFYFFVYRASMHMMLEPLLLFETILIENRSILELVDSDFTYRSNLLESLYRNESMSNDKFKPSEIEFRRVPLTDRREGGVITNAAIMTMTSNPKRTQPITRGAWVVSVIFNNPPNPPPANVPPLKEDEHQDKLLGLTLREKLRAHREQANCSGCHEKIDPYGFALENYNPIGLWRDNYESGQPIDASGTLFNRHEFKNIIEFKDAILKEKNRFSRAFSAHLLSFALGRKISIADGPALDRIARETAAADYQIQPLIKLIVLSEPFRQKYNPAERSIR